MYVCIHTNIHTYIHTYVHTYIHTYIHIHIYICMRVCVCVYVYTNIYVYAYVYRHAQIGLDYADPLRCEVFSLNFRCWSLMPAEGRLTERSSWYSILKVFRGLLRLRVLGSGASGAEGLGWDLGFFSRVRAHKVAWRSGSMSQAWRFGCHVPRSLGLLGCVWRSKPYLEGQGT